MLEYGNRGTLGSFHRVIVDDAPLDRAGTLVRVAIDSMDERGNLHAHVVEGAAAPVPAAPAGEGAL